jgi:hypothetical protein
MGSDRVPGQVLVRYREEATQLLSVSLLATATDVHYNPLLNVWRIDLPPDESVDRTVSELRADPMVALAQPNYLYSSAHTPDDPRFLEAQHPYYAAINAPAGWEVETGSPDVVVAVLDGGVDINHPELDTRIWANANEVRNGLDDDDNGCIDDVNGCSFLSDPPSGEISDYDGHGTFVAGIIGAESNNGVGVAGVAWDVTIMPVRVLDTQGVGTTEQLASGILYAARSGAHIENLSLALPTQAGTCPDDSLVDDALRQAHDDFGAVILSAAGNFDLNCVAFPASSPHTIAVAASGPPESPDTRAFFSQWGPEVDVAAPGIDIVSTLPGNAYGFNLGTSFSTPIVSGLAALLLSQDPARTNEEVRDIIRGTARNLPDDNRPNWDGAGIVDMGAALGGGSAFAFIDAQSRAIDALSFSVGVGDAEQPTCEVPIWQQPSLSGESVRGSFGIGECAAMWPPIVDQPWFLRGRYSGVKEATIQAWSIRSNDISCAAVDLPAVMPRNSETISRIDCLAASVIANDEPEQAQIVAPSRLPQRFQLDLRYATSEDDPSPSCFGSFSRSVWYRLPPTGTSRAVAVDTFGSDFDTVLALYAGELGELAEVACNDDFSSPQSRLVWQADGVSTYYLMAAAFQSVPAGRLRLNFSQGYIPANDSAAHASPIGSGTPYSLVQPAHSATHANGDPHLSCVPAYGFSLWFQAVAPADGELTLDTAGSEYDTVVGVFFEEEEELGEAGCNDDAGPGVRTSRLSWQARAGQAYRIVVGAYTGYVGGVLRLSLTSGPFSSSDPPAHDQFRAQSHSDRHLDRAS